MKLTFYGHACFMVETAGKKLLFDPFISGNDHAGHIDINSIQADYILISHGHGDHIADLITIAKNTGAMVIGMLEVCNWIQQQGYENVTGMNLGLMKTEFGSVRMVPAAHSSSLPDGSYATVRFQSSFFRQRNATETVTLRFETDKWRVVSYTVR